MDKPSRQKIVTGNWKMHKTVEEAKIFIQQLMPFVEKSSMKICLAVPFTAIYPLHEEFKGSKICIGAQNMNDASEGAFTGEIAGKMLKEAGAGFVLLGHSERRRLFNEDNSFINRKVKRAVSDGLQPVLCVGETSAEHEAGLTHKVLKIQLEECLRDLDAFELRNLIVAYEPIWAIGTGKSATPETADQTHLFCREQLSQLFSIEFAESVPIQYGGSVNESNAGLLLGLPNIDGLLVGGASLSLETFSQIVNDSQLNQLSIG